MIVPKIVEVPVYCEVVPSGLRITHGGPGDQHTFTIPLSLLNKIIMWSAFALDQAPPE